MASTRPNDTTKALSGKDRTNELQKSIIAVLAKYGQQGAPLCLVVDDAHWCDLASWKLLVQLVQEPAREHCVQ